MSQQQAEKARHVQEEDRLRRIRVARDKEQNRSASAAERRRNLEACLNPTLSVKQTPSASVNNMAASCMVPQIRKTPAPKTLSPSGKQYAFGSSTPRGLTFAGGSAEQSPLRRCSRERPSSSNKSRHDLMSTSMFVQSLPSSSPNSKTDVKQAKHKAKGSNSQKKRDHVINELSKNHIHVNACTVDESNSNTDLINVYDVTSINSEPSQNDDDANLETTLRNKVMSEEEAKSVLAERRRLAREHQDREREFERLRLEALMLAEEEEFRRQEQEELNLLREVQHEQETRLKLASEEQQRRKIEQEFKLADNTKRNAEIEMRNKDLNDRLEREREEKIRQDELDRVERKKKLENIRRRTRMVPNGDSRSISQNGTGNANQSGVKNVEDSANNNNTVVGKVQKLAIDQENQSSESLMPNPAADADSVNANNLKANLLTCTDSVLAKLNVPMGIANDLIHF